MNTSKIMNEVILLLGGVQRDNLTQMFGDLRD